MSSSAQHAAIAALLALAGLAAGAAAARVPPGHAEPVDRDVAEMRDHSVEDRQFDRSDSAAERDLRESGADDHAVHDAADQDIEPAHSYGRPSVGPDESGGGPSAQFRENFDIIYRFLTVRSQQQRVIFDLQKRLAVLTGRPLPAEPAGLGLVRASSAASVPEQEGEIRALMQEVRGNEDLIKRLRSRLGGESH
jgi:hypothetical protein